MYGDEHVRARLARQAGTVVERDEHVAVAGQVGPEAGRGVDLAAQLARDRQSDVLLAGPAGPDCAWVLAAMSGINGNDQRAHDCRGLHRRRVRGSLLHDGRLRGYRRRLPHGHRLRLHGGHRGGRRHLCRRGVGAAAAGHLRDQPVGRRVGRARGICCGRRRCRRLVLPRYVSDQRRDRIAATAGFVRPFHYQPGTAGGRLHARAHCHHRRGQVEDDAGHARLGLAAAHGLHQARGRGQLESVGQAAAGQIDHQPVGIGQRDHLEFGLPAQCQLGAGARGAAVQAQIIDFRRLGNVPDQAGQQG